MAYTVHSVQTYGAASKWSAEAAKSRASSSASANDIFFGPTQSGTDWGAAILTATSTDDSMADYVKRNYSKFSGGTLQAMLESTNLVDWYKGEMQKQIAEKQKSIADTQESMDLGNIGEPFSTNRIASILSSVAASTASTADDGDIITAPVANPDATPATNPDGTPVVPPDGTTTGTSSTSSTSSTTSTSSSTTASTTSTNPLLSSGSGLNLFV